MHSWVTGSEVHVHLRRNLRRCLGYDFWPQTRPKVSHWEQVRKILTVHRYWQLLWLGRICTFALWVTANCFLKANNETQSNPPFCNAYIILDGVWFFWNAAWFGMMRRAAAWCGVIWYDVAWKKSVVSVSVMVSCGPKPSKTQICQLMVGKQRMLWQGRWAMEMRNLPFHCPHWYVLSETACEHTRHSHSGFPRFPSDLDQSGQWPNQHSPANVPNLQACTAACNVWILGKVVS